MEKYFKDPVIKKTVKISYLDGSFAQIFSTLASPGSVFVTKFLVFLNATPLHFGLYSSIGQISQIFQIVGVILTKELKTRKKLVVDFAFWGRFLTILFGFIPFIFLKQEAIYIFLTIFLISNILQTISANMWIAWISDMIPIDIRGRFFSRRSQILMVVGLLTGYIFSILFDFLTKNDAKILKSFSIFKEHNVSYVFLFIFLVATVMGIIGVKILNNQPEKEKEIEKESIKEFLTSPFKDKNFIRFLIYNVWWMLAVGVGAPFWQPFMLKNLKMTLFEVQIYGTISTISALYFLRPWGVFIDKFGNRTAMRFALILGALNPLIWVFATEQTKWIIYFEAFTSGMMWSGANIVATNFVLSIAPDNKRQIYTAIQGTISGLAMMFSMMISSILIPKPLAIFHLNLSGEQVLFALTGILRLTAEIPLTLVREKRGKPAKYVLQYIHQTIKGRIESLISPDKK
ncbi:MAG: MFS transporter [candidate division WOR-3 bacterium]